MEWDLENQMTDRESWGNHERPYHGKSVNSIVVKNSNMDHDAPNIAKVGIVSRNSNALGMDLIVGVTIPPKESAFTDYVTGDIQPYNMDNEKNNGEVMK